MEGREGREDYHPKDHNNRYQKMIRVNERRGRWYGEASKEGFEVTAMKTGRREGRI
jgi:hypothetical protein